MVTIAPTIILQLNKILEHELAGVVRYTHYSFMVYGFGRIPIVGWLRDAANESLTHAHRAGEMITHFGKQPSLGIGKKLETFRHNVEDILNEALEFERAGIDMYFELLELVEQQTPKTPGLVMLEEYARELVELEEQHLGDIDKMLRKPGTLASVV